jgi:succinyl-CoA synthetase alpha subunit
MKAVTISRERYYDSVFLMIITREVKALSRINDAVVSLATPSNVENLARVGFTSPELEKAGPNDLVVAIDAENSETLAAAQAHVEEMLKKKSEASQGSVKERPCTLAGAVKLLPNANLVLISVPGPYAAREARGALDRGFHVMLFSDNVPIEEEIALKAEAYERGLFMMGPDCGTALINGVPLGFANIVRRGPIGIVGASGTGIQEISSLIDRYGGGISQAIGTGGHDLSKRVGGVMTRLGIEALGDDNQTKVIVVVSKAPSPDVACDIVETVSSTGKPAVVHFVGGEVQSARGNVVFAKTLADAARLACEHAGMINLPLNETITLPDVQYVPEQRFIRGYFCGGTLCQEAWKILARRGLDVRSNVATDPRQKIDPKEEADEHLLWDLGDDSFTLGKPHPMIEPSLRDERLLAAAEDPTVAVILVDLVLGYGSHPDPGSSLAAAATRAIEVARSRGRDLLVIASITGTDQDPQGLHRQRKTLEDASLIIASNNAAAAEVAFAVIDRMHEGGGAR